MFKNKKGYLSVSDVNVIKGVALILLLWHHLFYKINGLFDDIILSNGHFLINELGRICKMCVAIFVFLSGYGLTRQAEIKGGLDNLVQWYRHRFLKLMVNYWLIWLLFVPIGVFVFGRTLTDAYQTHVIWKFLADIFGMANAFGFHGYNGTWWFVTCILLLYLLYPLLYRGSKHSTWVVLLIGLVASFLPISTGASSIHPYLFPFVFGIAVALRPLPDLPAGGGADFVHYWCFLCW